VTCTPASGTVFPSGTSTVTCTATDAAQLTGSCTFSVVVSASPVLSATRFLAFGNSITEGKVASGDTPAPYPGLLQNMLAAHYSEQTIVVVNEGCGGERAAGVSDPPPCIGGIARLPGKLDQDNPQVLLLEEGVNDLTFGGPTPVPALIDALRTMIRTAKGRGVSVFLTTLTPVRVGGSPPRADGAAPFISAANDQIRMLAPSEGAVLVDLFNGLGGSPDPFIDVDGLHPTVTGYQKIAQLFFDAIRANLEMLHLVDNRRFDPEAWLMARR
jgi:lysophospholipase L1-like esterase